MANNNEPLFVDPVLLQQAEQLCKKRLQNDPQNRASLRSLAEVYRKLGYLVEAAAAYERLFCLDPHDQEAGYLAAVLGGKDWTTAPTGMRAAPFVLLRDFLPQAFHDGLIPLLISLRDKLAPALLGDGTYIPEYRETLDFMDKWEGQQRFRDCVKQVLPHLVRRLFLAPFRLKYVEAYLRAYLDGHFFRVHMDAPPNSARADRVLSFVYYFHKLPRPYTGGELLLFDSDIEVDKSFTRARFTCIGPEDNALVVFPSKFYHCVLPVHCPSREFADSRFVINGFVNKQTAAKPAGAGSAEGVGVAEGT